ncbi:MAG: SurA N-terminal domain-containing protein [Pseudomonadota bacterium]
MLLNLMRKHAKSWLIKFLIGIIAVVFVFYFGYSFKEGGGVKIAYVNGELISGLEYHKAYRESIEALQRQYKGLWNDNLIKIYDIKNQVLEKLIKQKLVSQEARSLGLDVTKKEIQDEIMAFPAFQFRGRFDESRYRALLQQNQMKPEDFEAGVADELLQRKLSQFLMTFLPVTDQEILDYYKFFNNQIEIGFVQFSPESFQESIKVDPSAMEKYFQEHKQAYRIPEKIRLSIIKIDPEDFEKAVKVGDQELKDYYEENIERYKEKMKVKARHILMKLEENAPEGEEKKVREKALSIAKKAREGGDFEKLAKESSEGPTREDGGDLGYFSKGEMLKPFEEAAFNMKKGEISDPVRSPLGYHIIKVEDIKEARTKTFDEVRKEITEQLTKIASINLAHEKALSLMDQMPYEVDLKQYAERHGISVTQPDYFSQNEAIPDIGGDEKLRQSLFSLKKNDVSELLEFDNKFYIVQVIDKTPSRLPDSKGVYEELKKNYLSHLSIQEAKASAEKYLGQLREGKSWDDMAKENRLVPKTTEFFTRKDPIPQIGSDHELREAAFHLSKNKPYPDKVFVHDQKVFVIRWEGQEGIDEEKYQKEKAELGDSLILRKRQIVFGEWMEGLRKKAEIELVTKID